MHETLLWLGAGAAAITAITTLVAFIVRHLFRAHFRDEDVARAGRDAKRDAEAAAMLKLIADQSKVIEDLKHEVSIMRQEQDTTVQRVVKLETVVQSIPALDAKLDKIIDKLWTK